MVAQDSYPIEDQESSSFEVTGHEDNSCKNSRSIEDGIGPNEFHEFYLQQGGIEYMTPIVFEDGMDFVECNLYYASIESQQAGGSFRGTGWQRERQSRIYDAKDLSHSNLRSCLRKSTASKKEGETKLSKSQVRRCSFGGFPELKNASYDMPPMLKASSSRELDECKARVDFEEYVQVVTIYHVDDLPFDVRSQMWLSKQEMVQGVRRAILEERERKAREMRARAIAEAEAARSKERKRPSVDSVIMECIQSVSSEMQERFMENKST